VFPEHLISSNALLAWLIAVSLATAVFTLLRIARPVIVSRLTALSLRASTKWDDIAVEVVRRTGSLFLGDLFSSMAIVLDKPFVISDFIVVGHLEGTVEKVGLKTTRLKPRSGQLLIFPSADLPARRMRNFGRIQERRIKFELGVTSQTPRSTLEQIPVMLRTAVEAQSPVRFDRAHVASYGDFSLDFEAVYFELTADFNQYMKIRQQANLSIHEQFEAADVQFALPTQTLVMTRPAAARRPLTSTGAG